MKLNVKLRESRMRKKEKSKDSENYKKRLLIDKLKLMPSAPKELSKKVKDKPEKERDLNNKRGREFKLIWKLLDKDNFLKSKLVLLNKLELKERIT
jgi:hypothetical protein